MWNATKSKELQQDNTINHVKLNYVQHQGNGKWNKKMIASCDVNPEFLLCQKRKKQSLFYSSFIHCLKKQTP